jgi:hypothetical protein
MKYLLQPFDADERARDRLANSIRQTMACEAVSIFFAQRDDDQKTFALKLFSQSGYNDKYRDQRYGLDPAESLTSYIFRSEKPLNESGKALAEGHIKSYSGRCRFFLPSKKLRNILAIPILTSSNSCCGILKCENRDGFAEDACFPEPDFKFAITLASAIGMHYCQKAYGSIWADWAKQKQKTIQNFAEVLASRVPSECASIFVKQQTGTSALLRYEAGVGYKSDYAKQVYPLENRPKHFTAFVAMNLGVPVRYTEKELIDKSKAGEFPKPSGHSGDIGWPTLGSRQAGEQAASEF